MIIFLLLIKFIIIVGKMCYDYYCAWDCCNYYGYCPEEYGYSSNWRYNSCYTYYSRTSSNAGVIAGAVVGAVVAIVLLIALSCYCYRRRQAQRIMMQQNMMNMNQNSTNTLMITRPEQNMQYPSYPPASNYPPGNNGQPIYGNMNYNPQTYNQSGQPYQGNMPYGQPVNPYNPYVKGF